MQTTDDPIQLLYERPYNLGEPTTPARSVTRVRSTYGSSNYLKLGGGVLRGQEDKKYDGYTCHRRPFTPTVTLPQNYEPLPQRTI